MVEIQKYEVSNRIERIKEYRERFKNQKWYHIFNMSVNINRRRLCMIADTVYIPFPGMELKVIRPASAMNLIEPFVRNNITGCNKRCPCSTWVSCSRYNKNVWKSLHPEEFDKELHEWYDTQFKLNYELPYLIPNG